jgi:hypothetical protein
VVIVFKNNSQSHGQGPFEVAHPKEKEKWLRKGYMKNTINAKICHQVE